MWCEGNRVQNVRELSLVVGVPSFYFVYVGVEVIGRYSFSQLVCPVTVLIPMLVCGSVRIQSMEMLSYVR